MFENQFEKIAEKYSQRVIALLTGAGMPVSVQGLEAHQDGDFGNDMVGRVVNMHKFAALVVGVSGKLLGDYKDTGVFVALQTTRLQPELPLPYVPMMALIYTKTLAIMDGNISDTDQFLRHQLTKDFSEQMIGNIKASTANDPRTIDEKRDVIEGVRDIFISTGIPDMIGVASTIGKKADIDVHYGYAAAIEAAIIGLNLGIISNQDYNEVVTGVVENPDQSELLDQLFNPKKD